MFKVPDSLEGGLFFFNGKRQHVTTEKTFPVYEPRIGKVVCQCAIADDNLVEQITLEAEKAQQQWSKVAPLERAKILSRAAEIIQANAESIAQWEVRTNGKCINEAKVDVDSSADTFRFYAGITPEALKGAYFDLPVGEQERFAYTRREPYGVVGCIGAWNYPFQTCVWKIVPALAAGNSVVYKPSPFAPASPVLVGEILRAAGLPDGLYNVVQGDASTGEALCLNEHIRKVSFTGSVATGQAIQRTCATRSIKPVTLELGGKSAFIVFEDSDVKEAVAAAILANFLNQGEVCTNATRVFVHESLSGAFKEALLTELANLKVGDPLKPETNVGAMINEGHLQKVLGFVERAKAQGAKLLRGGSRLHPDGVPEGFYFDPAVLDGVTDDMEVATDEIFGPVMLILTFRDEEEVIRRANNTSYGLAAGLYTKCLSRAHRVAARLSAGTVFVNTYNDTEVHIPFGGYKNSGHGRENCIECLHAFTQIKSVYVNISGGLEHNVH
ncbi:Protein ALH-12 b [Aphelenchoides avenae]|nr:Protein ALH-12 b [Aphelenchus avenae]